MRSKTIILKVKKKFRKALVAKKIGLALSGGGAYGFAHIGVVKAMEEFRIPINFLSGTSAGSVIGALVAGGLNSEGLEELAHTIKWRKLFRLSASIKGFARNDGIKKLVHGMISDRHFEDLSIPLSVAATDFNEGKLVVFDHGPVAPAVQASCTIPVLFEPVIIDNTPYVDGGLMLNLPVTPLREKGAEFFIAVNLLGSMQNPHINAKTVFAVAAKSFLMMLSKISMTDTTPPDLLIQPDMKGLNPFSAASTDAFIDRGYRAAKRLFAELAEE